MKLEIVATSVLPRHTAARIAALLTEAVETRGHGTLALSGGSGVRPMFTALAALRVPWEHIHIVQVDERMAPDGDPARNWNDASSLLVDALTRLPAGVHPMPVAHALEDTAAATEAVDRYLDVLEDVAGLPIGLDVVHLGLGDDGHTASLVPGDAVLEVIERDVAITEPYRGHQRMTLTYPALARARHVLWLVAGAEKANVVKQLVQADPSIPAGRVPQEHATLLLDPDAASALR